MGEAEKKDFHHLIHTWIEEMVKKAIIYNTKKEEKKRGRKKNRLEKKEGEREREKTKGLKKYNSKNEEYSTLRLIIRACLRILSEYVRR